MNKYFLLIIVFVINKLFINNIYCTDKSNDFIEFANEKNVSDNNKTIATFERVLIRSRFSFEEIMDMRLHFHKHGVFENIGFLKMSLY